MFSCSDVSENLYALEKDFSRRLMENEKRLAAATLQAKMAAFMLENQPGQGEYQLRSQWAQWLAR